ncbi:MAG: MFS transporter [Opitutales bacterium]
MPTLPQRRRITFRYDLVRGTCQGFLETGAHTFALLIAVRVFEASPALKAFLAGAGPYGLLLTPVSLYIVSRLQISAASAASFFFFAASLSLVVAAMTSDLATFVAATVFAFFMIGQHAPLMVHIYSQNYDSRNRGALLSNSIVLSVTAATLFAFLGGKALDVDLERYRSIILTLALASLIAAWAIRRMPSSPLSAGVKSWNPLKDLSYAWKDKLFGGMLIIWMLMGLGNLMTLPLRVEYMANPRFGIDATNAEIALMTAVIPSLVRILTTHIWGILFDRLNFAVVRTLLNSCFFIGILLFFNSESLFMLGVASAIFGLGMAGGNIAWSLWVTKIAPDDKVATYMSIHTFTTGLRGVVAPFLGFFLLAIYPPELVAWLAALLIGLSIMSLSRISGRFDAGGKKGKKTG